MDEARSNDDEDTSNCVPPPCARATTPAGRTLTADLTRSVTALALFSLAVAFVAGGAAAVTGTSTVDDTALSRDDVEAAQAANETVTDLQTVFQRQYGGEQITSAADVVETADGDFLVVGSTQSPGSNDEQAWLARVNDLGEVEWTRTYGGEDNDWFREVVSTDDGGFVLAGSSRASPRTGNAWLVRVDGTGAVEWERSYNRSRKDSANSVVQTADGGFVFGGTTNATEHTQDAWLVKVNATGGVEREWTYHNIGDEWVNSVFEEDDGYVFAGFTRSIWERGDAWLVKVNTTGAVQWKETYGGIKEDEPIASIQTADGGYLLAGGTNTSLRSVDGWMVKTNATGGVEWTNTYGVNGHDQIHSVVQTDDGGYLFTGPTSSFGPSFNWWVAKTTSEGEVTAAKTYGGDNADWGNSVIQTGNSFLTVGNVNWGFGTGNASAIKLELVRFVQRTPDSSQTRSVETPDSTTETTPAGTDRPETATSPTPSPAPPNESDSGETEPAAAQPSTSASSPSPSPSPSGPALRTPFEGSRLGLVVSVAVLFAVAFIASRRTG